MLRRKGWFETLFGFEEFRGSVAEYGKTRELFKLLPDPAEHPDSGMRVIQSPEATYRVGSFTTPSLGDLRREAARRGLGAPSLAPRKLRLSHVAMGDILREHGRKEYAGAMFQAASQFNCLEFPGPHTVPEGGITGYECDNTQGPACSLACGAATVQRNYFGLEGERGQVRDPAGLINSVEPAPVQESTGGHIGRQTDRTVARQNDRTTEETGRNTPH